MAVRKKTHIREETCNHFITESTNSAIQRKNSNNVRLVTVFEMSPSTTCSCLLSFSLCTSGIAPAASPKASLPSAFCLLFLWSFVCRLSVSFLLHLILLLFCCCFFQPAGRRLWLPPLLVASQAGCHWLCCLSAAAYHSYSPLHNEHLCPTPPHSKHFMLREFA